MTPFDVSLARIAAAAPDGDWWLIGSAAAKLSGIELEPEDVDIVAAPDVIEAFARNLGGGEVVIADSPLFHSNPFIKIAIDGGLPVELMGDLRILSGDGLPLRITTRVAIPTPAGPVYVPSLAEQADIFDAFGRPKDLAKARLIRLPSVKA